MQINSFVMQTTSRCIKLSIEALLEEFEPVFSNPLFLLSSKFQRKKKCKTISFLWHDLNVEITEQCDEAEIIFKTLCSFLAREKLG